LFCVIVAMLFPSSWILWYHFSVTGYTLMYMW